jgi:O-antigen/teichoic acid export membrane protein
MSPEFRRAALTSIACRIIAASAAAGFFALVVLQLGSDGAGAYLFAHTIAQLAGLLGRFGSEAVLIRLTASNPGGAQAGALLEWPRFQRLIFCGSIATSTVVALVGVLALWSGALVPSVAFCLLWLAPSVFASNFVQMRGELLKATLRPGAAQLVQSAAIPTLTGALWLLLYFVEPSRWMRPRADQLACLYCLATFSAMVATRWIAPSSSFDRSRNLKLAAILRESWPLLVASSGRYVLPWIPLWVLGATARVADAGVFGLAMRIALVLELAIVAINSVIGPRVAVAIAKRDPRTTGQIVGFARRILLLSVGPLALVMILSPGLIISPFGIDYAGAISVLPVLGVAQLLHLWAGPMGMILSMGGRGRDLRNCVLLAVAVCSLLSLSLIPRLGILGAAIAVASAMGILCVAQTQQALRSISGRFATPDVAEDPSAVRDGSSSA